MARLRKPAAGQPLRAGAVIIGTADAIGIVVGIVHADNKRPRHDEREHRAADMPAANTEGRARTCDNGCEGVGPRMWASTIDPILGGRGIITG